MNLRPFQGFTDQELIDIGEAFDSAAGEGGFGNFALAQALAAEATERGTGLRLAYGHSGDLEPSSWLRRSGVAEYRPNGLAAICTNPQPEG